LFTLQNLYETSGKNLKLQDTPHLFVRMRYAFYKYLEGNRLEIKKTSAAVPATVCYQKVTQGKFTPAGFRSGFAGRSSSGMGRRGSSAISSE